MSEIAPHPGPRPIRSYVLRQGRMTPAQQAAFERLWQRYGIELKAHQTLQPDSLFDQQGELFLEIGFGNGEALAQRAQSRPQHNHLGIEVHGPGVGHLLLEAESAELSNLRVLRADAAEVLRHALPEACLSGIYLFFPDPWPKKKHHKRRIVQPQMLEHFARCLKPGGLVHMATDWENYAQHMLACLNASDQFTNSISDGDYIPRPEDRPLTRFEQRGLRLGHGVWDLLFIRNPDPA